MSENEQAPEHEPRSDHPMATDGDAISRQYRQAAGLPERTSDSSEIEEVERTVAHEPEGGYGNPRGGVKDEEE